MQFAFYFKTFSFSFFSFFFFFPVKKLIQTYKQEMNKNNFPFTEDFYEKTTSIPLFTWVIF